MKFKLQQELILFDKYLLTKATLQLLRGGQLPF